MVTVSCTASCSGGKTLSYRSSIVVCSSTLKNIPVNLAHLGDACHSRDIFSTSVKASWGSISSFTSMEQSLAAIRKRFPRKEIWFHVSMEEVWLSWCPSPNVYTKFKMSVRLHLVNSLQSYSIEAGGMAEWVSAMTGHSSKKANKFWRRATLQVNETDIMSRAGYCTIRHSCSENRDLPSNKSRTDPCKGLFFFFVWTTSNLSWPLLCMSMSHWSDDVCADILPNSFPDKPFSLLADSILLEPSSRYSPCSSSALVELTELPF